MARAPKTVKIGIIGCGNIVGIYLKNLCERFNGVAVKAAADLIPKRSAAAARQYKGIKACTVRQLLADKSIHIVLNLTTPDAHYDVAMAAVKAGKSIYNEKPLTITRRQGQELLAAAKKARVFVGGAPDTFLGGGLQTCRKLIDDGWIGKPIAATAFMTCHGHEMWHPNPEFFYKPGGGPMFDMGPYYVTAMVALMGRVKRVTGSTQTTFATRRITSQPLFGNVVDVEIPTHVVGVLDFAAGAVGTIITSFDVWSANLPRIEIYGTTGSLSVPDPNTFGGPVRVRRAGADEWTDVPLSHGYAVNSRGIGITDMARALQTRRAHRANGELCYHVLDIMHAIHDASAKGRHVKLVTKLERPAPLPLGLADGEVD